MKVKLIVQPLTTTIVQLHLQIDRRKSQIMKKMCMFFILFNIYRKEIIWDTGAR